jgi:hypothetical protein
MCDEQTGPADEKISAAASRSTQPTAAGTNHPGRCALTVKTIIKYLDRIMANPILKGLIVI